ncbi:hypothetical protein R1flu_012374 [Riccia fluitans]|uniref:Ig-like domain-containing protein n=1 Tax=Riccia fluitans TaxID=41844 RepID=A0ABD1ZAF7_9MARC
MELPAFRREGSNKHIKGCERASKQLKFEIRAMNNRQRERAADLASLHDMESTSRALDEEEREIESTFLSNIRGEPSSAYARGPQGSDARPYKSNFSSPSSVANAGEIQIKETRTECARPSMTKYGKETSQNVRRESSTGTCQTRGKRSHEWKPKSEVRNWQKDAETAKTTTWTTEQRRSASSVKTLARRLGIKSNLRWRAGDCQTLSCYLQLSI